MQARPNSSPARNWRPSMPDRSARTTRAMARGAVAGLHRPLGRGLRSRAGRPRRPRRPDRPGARSPTARSARPTARTWAWYQVVPIWAEYQSTVPKAKNTVVARRTQRRIGSPPSAHQAMPTSMAADDGEDELAVGAVAPRGDERQQEDGRQRRERDVAARHAVVRRHLADVVEERVAGRVVRGLDRIADRGLALEEGLRLPLEVVVEAERLRCASRRPGRSRRGRARSAEPTVTHASGRASAVRPGPIDPVLPCDPPQIARAGGLSPLTARAPGGSSRGADAPTRMTWTRDGVGAILIVLAAALAFRLIIAYSYPGTGLDVRSRLLPGMGRATSPATASTASTSGPASTTTPPGTSTSSTSSASSARRRAASGT